MFRHKNSSTLQYLLRINGKTEHIASKQNAYIRYDQSFLHLLLRMHIVL